MSKHENMWVTVTLLLCMRVKCIKWELCVSPILGQSFLFAQIYYEKLNEALKHYESF